MRYSTIVEKDDKTLVEIIEALEQFERERFIAGIQGDNAQKEGAHGGESEKNGRIRTTRLFCITLKPLNLYDYEHAQIGKHQSACTL